MLINSLPDVDGSRCTLSFDERNQWLRATWRGFVGPAEAMRGADNYLAQKIRCAYLLNDNSALQGPWFDSVEWLERVWMPQARHLGLRYVAHVVQADTHADILTVAFPGPVVGWLELQMFQALPAAEAWLHDCQRRF